MAPSSGKAIAVGITNSKASQRAVAYAATQLAQPGDTIHLLCVLLDTTLADDHFARRTYARIQRIIAERFLPLLDDVFVAHRTHILRTTAYTGGPACIAGVLGSKSVDLGASVLVVGNGASNMLSSILFPSVAKSVAKLKRTPVVVVSSNGSVQHYGCGERAGEVETWDGGCALQARACQKASLQVAPGNHLGTRPQSDLLSRASAVLLRSASTEEPISPRQLDPDLPSTSRGPPLSSRVSVT
ncbi:hypothetical protein COCOBI_09-3030 [Coccomyxa sp. Obi]|nr:hypothetical protein COCOBI_09-3030 [Coccomyxa sp. Obi]